jgi:hypothetical protein
MPFAPKVENRSLAVSVRNGNARLGPLGFYELGSAWKVR